MFFKLFLLAVLSISIAQSYEIKKKNYDKIKQLQDINNQIFENEWDEFKAKYGRTYESMEKELKGKLIYAKNKKMILEHNDLYDKGVVTYRMRMTSSGDYDPEEFTPVTSTPAPENDTQSIEVDLTGSTFVPPQGVKIPASMDWRKFGAVTRVKNQGGCGSCWAFGAVGALEGQLFRETGRLVELSEQNLLDCSTEYGNYECEGGYSYTAFKYIEMNGGIDTEKSYPYTGKFGECRYKSNYSMLSEKGFMRIAPGDEKLLQVALAVGPISVDFDASNPGFTFYDSGVYFDHNCLSEETNHVVTLVGYGKDAKTGVDYWLIKNSWGSDWGENGYMRVARNRRNHCGIASSATYPLLSEDYAFNNYY